MGNLESKLEKSPSEILADKLDKLQSEKNDGHGVSCVKAIVMFLKRGDMESAKAVCWNEGDKIRNYPDIRKFLQKELFSEDEKKDIPPYLKISSDE